MTEPRIGFPGELRVGDLVQSYRDLEFYMIEKLSGPITWDCSSPYYRVFLSSKRNKLRPILLVETLPILVIRSEVCGTPVCDVHYMDRGKPICAYHWQLEIVTPEVQNYDEHAHA